MSQFEHKSFYRRNLPHIQPLGATFFVTFHLAGSLPKKALQQYRTEKTQLEIEKRYLTSRQNDSEPSTTKQMHLERKSEHLEWRRQWFRKLENILDDAENGPVWLKDCRIAKVVADSLHYRDGKVYRLDAYCIMSNHVHVVFTPLPMQLSKTGNVNLPVNTTQTNSLCYNTLSTIMQSLKGYTARKANCLLGRSGTFWQHESYDHVVRDPSEWRRIVNYVLNNPVKAGLVDTWEKWQWSYCRLESSPNPKT